VETTRISALSSKILVNAVIVLVSLGLGGVLIALFGANPVGALVAIGVGAFGSIGQIGFTLNLTGILVLTGLSVLIAFRSKIWNIGSDGQIYLGAIGAMGVYFLRLDPLSTLLLAFVAGALAGGLWGAIAGALKSFANVDEIVSTIMLNYIAYLLTDFLAGGPWKDPSSGFRFSIRVADLYSIPSLIPGSTLTIGIAVSVPVALLSYVMLFRTKIGFDMRIMGSRKEIAQYAGVRIHRTTILTMFISGALSGIVGVFLVYSVSHVLALGISRSYGLIGIGVATLADLNPIGVIFAATFFAMLNTGGDWMQRVTGVPYVVVQVVTASIILIVLLRPVFSRLKVLR
jgi:simple sugar transport system permease protein